MFSGIIEETGRIESIQRTSAGIRMQLRSEICGSDLKIGSSLAVNGCCLTVVDIEPTGSTYRLAIDLLEETWKRTNLHQVKSDNLVNLERALPANGRLDGHFVTGHIDGTGTIRRWVQHGGDWLLRVEAPADIMRYIVFKGSIAIDGISLTVAEVTADHFDVWIIPHTYAVTALHERQVGDLVNLEADLLAKYVEKLAGK